MDDLLLTSARVACKNKPYNYLTFDFDYHEQRCETRPTSGIIIIWRTISLCNLLQVSYVSALDIWHFVSQALIFLVLLEYSFVSYYMTRGTVNCKHRQASISSKIINVSFSCCFYLK
jgi:hypothetical protein